MELYKDSSKEYIRKRLCRDFDHPGTLLFRGRELEAIARYTINNPLSSGKCVLDLGCGEGNIGSIVFNKIDVGLDVSFADALKASGCNTYKGIVTAEAGDIPFKDRAFDVIFSNSVIEHIKNMDKVLREVSRVLVKGGLFIFTVPSDKFTQYISMGLGGRLYANLRNRQLSHFNLLSEYEWHERLKFLSFSVIYKDSYLSEEEIAWWDKACIILRLTRNIAFVRNMLKDKLYNQAKNLLGKNQVKAWGAALLIVARKDT